jgi:hypothetical protein
MFTLINTKKDEPQIALIFTNTYEFDFLFVKISAISGLDIILKIKIL